ncbi:hypothetical protein C8Q73DRAFT_668219 [Cubamyces lactineus]|nr:hypothetical protein C8Q73DRAFT_668219 [Cubamyces lactineus]
MPDSHPPSPHGDIPASQPTSSTLNINTLADFAASLPPSLRGLDPSVLVSMLTALTTGQSNTPVALPQPETGHNNKLMVCADIDVAHHAVRTSLAVTIRTHSPAVPMSQVRHLVPPEALPPSPTMARLAQPVEYPTVPGPPRSQMYPVVPWNYGDRSAPGHTSTPARENVGQMRTSLDPALQSDGGLMGHDHGGDVGGSQASSDTSGGSWELSQLSPAGRAALNDLIKKQVEVVVAKREREPEADPGPVVRASKKSRGVILEPREIPVKVRHAIWTNTHFLLGTGADATISRTGRPTHFKLPKPDDPVKYAPDGTRLYNPDWGIPIDEGINDQFISAVVKLTMSNGADVVGDEGLLTLAAKAYLKSLKRMFMLQSSGDRGTQQLTKKRVSDKLHGRRARKCDNLASAIPVFRKVFGHANTVGIEEVVQVGWMSDEHSAGEGKEDAARESRRHAAGVGPSAWEVWSPLWRSRKLFIIYFVLAVIRRYTYDFKIKLKSKGRRAEGSLAPTPAVAHSGSDDEFSSDLSDGARTNFIDHMASAGRMKLVCAYLAMVFRTASTRNALVVNGLRAIPNIRLTIIM